jgi:hypothetical protein
MDRLTRPEWLGRQLNHRERVSPFATERLKRMSKHVKHPIDDFLFEYYSFRPAQLLRWSPGCGVILDGASGDELGWKEFLELDGGIVLDANSFPKHRLRSLHWTIDYLEGIAIRPASFNCFGLHEWAMLYRSTEPRHASTPLRLPLNEIARIVDAEGLRCTHFDAFRFFTPQAVPLNRVPLSRDNLAEHDQKGCIHVTMDLYRYAYKFAPWCSGELIADAFLLARQARTIDMRASPYDLRDYGIEPIRIETREGREEYVERQRELTLNGEPIRERLISEYRRLLAERQ